MKQVYYQSFLQAKHNIKQRKYKQAEIILQSLMKKIPDDSMVIFEYARLLAKMKKYNQAKQYFKSLFNTSNYNYAVLELGRLEVILGNYNQAKQYFKSLLNKSDYNYAALELGRLEVTLGNYDKAKEYFKSLLNTSNHNYATLELGRLEVTLGNYNQAKQNFKSLLNTSSHNYAVLELGRLEVILGNDDNAKQYFKSLLNTSNHNYALLELFFLYLKQKNYDKLKDICINDLMFITNKTEYKKRMEFLMKYIVGDKDIYNSKYNGYWYNQYRHYDKTLALEHISNHLTENNEKIVHSVFFSENSISHLYGYIKIKISHLKPIRVTTDDHYEVECPFLVGYSFGKTTNLISVVTTHDTKNIITMYPLPAKYLYKTEKVKVKNKVNKM